jgi:hypothetical protein
VQRGTLAWLEGTGTIQALCSRSEDQNGLNPSPPAYTIIGTRDPARTGLATAGRFRRGAVTACRAAAGKALKGYGTPSCCGTGARHTARSLASTREERFLAPSPLPAPIDRCLCRCR